MMSVWLSVNLLTIVLGIVSYCRNSILRAENKPSQSGQKITLALVFAIVLASQLLWFACFLQFSTWAALDLCGFILVVYLTCYAFYLDSKRSPAVIVYFGIASSLLTLTLLSAGLRYFFST